MTKFYSNITGNLLDAPSCAILTQFCLTLQNMRRSFSLITLARKSSEGWNIIYWTAGIQSFVSNTKQFLSDKRKLRYLQNNSDFLFLRFFWNALYIYPICIFYSPKCLQFGNLVKRMDDGWICRSHKWVPL